MGDCSRMGAAEMYETFTFWEWSQVNETATCTDIHEPGPTSNGAE